MNKGKHFYLIHNENLNYSVYDKQSPDELLKFKPKQSKNYQMKMELFEVKEGKDKRCYIIACQQDDEKETHSYYLVHEGIEIATLRRKLNGKSEWTVKVKKQKYGPNLTITVNEDTTQFVVRKEEAVVCTFKSFDGHKLGTAGGEFKIARGERRNYTSAVVAVVYNIWEYESKEKLVKERPLKPPTQHHHHHHRRASTGETDHKTTKREKEAMRSLSAGGKPVKRSRTHHGKQEVDDDEEDDLAPLPTSKPKDDAHKKTATGRSYSEASKKPQEKHKKDHDQSKEKAITPVPVEKIEDPSVPRIDDANAPESRRERLKEKLKDKLPHHHEDKNEKSPLAKSKENLPPPNSADKSKGDKSKGDDAHESKREKIKGKFKSKLHHEDEEELAKKAEKKNLEKTGADDAMLELKDDTSSSGYGDRNVDDNLVTTKVPKLADSSSEEKPTKPKETKVKRRKVSKTMSVAPKRKTNGENKKVSRRHSTEEKRQLKDRKASFSKEDRPKDRKSRQTYHEDIHNAKGKKTHRTSVTRQESHRQDNYKKSHKESHEEDPKKSHRGSHREEDPKKSHRGSHHEEDPKKSHRGSHREEDPKKSHRGSHREEEHKKDYKDSHREDLKKSRKRSSKSSESSSSQESHITKSVSHIGDSSHPKAEIFAFEIKSNEPTRTSPDAIENTMKIVANVQYNPEKNGDHTLSSSGLITPRSKALSSSMEMQKTWMQLDSPRTETPVRPHTPTNKNSSRDLMASLLARKKAQQNY